MRLSKTSAHAALAIAFLANRINDPITQARQVAEYLSIPTDSALKVLQNLARRGLINSQLGRGGGYRLEKPADQITLLDVVEATDGPIDAAMPLRLTDPGAGPGLDLLQSICEQAAEAVRRELSGVTVADLARAQEGAVLTESR